MKKGKPYSKYTYGTLAGTKFNCPNCIRKMNFSYVFRSSFRFPVAFEISSFTRRTLVPLHWPDINNSINLTNEWVFFYQNYRKIVPTIL